MNNDEKRLLSTNLLFMILGLILLTLGAVFQRRNLIIGLLQTELFIVLLPAIIYILVKKISFRDLFFNPLKIKDTLWVILATFLFYPIALFLNTSFNFIMGLILGFSLPSTPLPQNLNEFLIYIPVISLSAGICEEILFRGLIMHEYKKMGAEKSILLSGILFGLFHFNLHNLVGPIVLGIFFGYMVYKTKSILAGIIGHALNNFISLFLGFLASFLPSEEMVQGMQIEPIHMVFPLIFWGMYAFVSMQFFRRVIFKIGDGNEALAKPEIELGALKKIIWLPLVLSLIFYIYLTLRFY
ncbi:MAG: type II CAAX endopeptidase family protein [Peptostreptococcales bacterium]|jgi:membrane protease YdiL (CAAX protease family)